jgi:predicted RNase H-like HicB family nuclease
MDVKQASHTKRRNPAAVIETHPLAALDVLTVDLEWDPDTKNWVSLVRELDLSDFGKTQEQALDRTQAMILSWLDTMEDFGLRIPLSSSKIQKIRAALA